MNLTRDHFYLNKTDGKLFGVCAGFADYVGVDVLWIRLAAVALTLLGGGTTIPIYLLIAFIAKRRPSPIDRYDDARYDDARYDDNRDAEDRLVARRFADRERRARSTRLRTDLGDMDRRLAAMESHFRGDPAVSSADIDHTR